MTRKIVWTAVGLLFVAAPAAAFAQASGSFTSCSSNETVQCLQNEITQLVQILDLLLGQHGNQTPSATITSPSAQSNTSFSVTGTVQNSSAVIVVLVGVDKTGGTYSGATDWGTIGGYLQGTSNATTIAGNQLYSYTGAVTGNRQFSIPFSNVLPGNYTVLVYNSDYSQYALMAQGTLAVAVPQNPAQNDQASSTLVASDPIPTPYSIVSGGTTGVIVGSFTLQPTSENVNLQEIGLDLAAQSASPADISSVSIWDGATQVGMVNFDGATPSGTCPPNLTGSLGSCYFATSTISSLTLPQNVQTTFTVKADISPIGPAEPGTPGDDIIISLADAQGAGASSATVVNSGPVPAPTVSGARIFRSYPAVGLTPLPSPTISVGNNQVLLRFSVTANSSGPVGIASMIASMHATGVLFSSLTTYGFTDAGFSQPVSGTYLGSGNLGALTGDFSSSAISVGFTNGTGKPIEIPGGETYYFKLVGNVSSISGNAAVTTTVDADPSYAALAAIPPGPVLTNGNGADFDWSPNDEGTSQFSTVDWTSGFGVLGLPEGGITQTITGQGVATTSPILTPPAPSSGVTITASPTTVPSGSRASVSWSSSNGASSCSYLSTNNAPSDYSYNNNAPTTGETGVGPLTSNATYQITCGGQTASVTITVTPPAASAPTCTESFSPSPVAAGQNFTDTWSSTGATSMTLVADLSGNPVLGPGPSGVNGSYQTSYLTPGTYDYTRTVTGQGGTGQCSTALLVLPNAAPGPVVTLTVNGQASIPYTTNYTLAWNSSGAASCTLAWQGSGSQVSQQGSQSIAPDTSGSGPSGLFGSYTFTCTDSSGHSSSQSASTDGSQSSATDQNANLANALIGLQSALQALRNWLGSH